MTDAPPYTLRHWLRLNFGWDITNEWFSPDQSIIAEIEAIKAYRDARGEPHILTFERI